MKRNLPTDYELLTMAAWKISDTLEAIKDGSFDSPDKDWNRDLSELLNTLVRRIKKDG